jgi:hypothetical protein
MLSVIITIVIMPRVILMSVIGLNVNLKESHYNDFHNAESHFAECYNAHRHYDECHYPECHLNECHYA